MEKLSIRDKGYDAIIIGAGFGGLFCANHLSIRGKRVLLIEQHRTPGGYICGFKRKNYYFDGANNSFSSHGIIFTLLEELGIDGKIKFHKHEISHVVDSIGLKFKYDSIEVFSRALLEAFKKEHKIKEFINVLNDFYRFFQIIENYPNPLLHSGTDKFKCIFNYGKVMFFKETQKCLKSIIKYGALNSEKFVSKFFEEGSDAYKFFRNYGNPNQNAIVLGAMIAEFIKDKWYPEGGEQHFADVLASNAEEHGAKIMYKTLATKIITKNKRAIGVETSNGVFYADNIVFGSDYKKAFNVLLDDKTLVKPSFMKRLEKAEVSESLFTVYLGLKCDREEVRERLMGNRMNYSRIILPKDTVKLVDDPNYFNDITISIFSPSVASEFVTPDGYSSVVIQCLCPARWLNNWGNEDRKIYKELKQRVTNQMLEIFNNAVPGLLDKAEYIESATPKTYERYTLNTDGSYCAWSWEPKKSFFSDIKIHTKTPIKNLYCCSDWCYKIGGMVSAMIAGRNISKSYIK